MCIIASIKSNQQISKETLKRCWDNNPHGGGFMFTTGSKVETFKEMTSFKRYYRAFCEKRTAYPHSNFVCHFRISTHGKINETNCHPFNVNNKLGFVHNGIIRNSTVSPDYSDTYMFNEEILKQLPDNFTSNQAILDLLKEYIGSGSKLCFLASDNSITYVNHEAGQTDENGVWFSNGGYKETKYYDAGGTRVGTYGQSWGGGWADKTYYGSNTKKDSHKSSYKQSSMGFASSVIPNVSKDSFESRIKTDTKIDREVVVVAHGRSTDKYSYEDTCGFCDTSLTSYTEKTNGYCFKCEDKYTQEWSL